MRITNSYIKRLIEIKTMVDATQGDRKKEWIEFLLGYITALEKLKGDK